MSRYTTTIGLEVHVQLQSRTKLFCSCPNRREADPNTLTCPVCLGLPGVLPSLNRQAVQLGIKAGLALNCNIASFTKFDRKNYFYPDLPKNYQISQYDKPLATDGSLTISESGGNTTVGIERIHLEEDAGKLIHANRNGRKDTAKSYVDLNRTGVPLLEIVTRPDLKTPGEAYRFLQRLKRRIQYAGVSDCSMEKGSLRCDANLSIRAETREELGTKVEVKNLNSFKNVRRSLEFEQKRQIRALKQGEQVRQLTCRFNPDTGETIPMRTKQFEADYRYFPEPDIPPLTIDRSRVKKLQKTLPEMPDDRAARYRRELNLDSNQAEELTRRKLVADYFEEALKAYKNPESIYNWIMGELKEYLNQEDLSIDQCPVGPERLAKLAELFEQDKITSTASRDIFGAMTESDKDPETIMKEQGLAKIQDQSRLENLVEEVIKENEQPVQDYLDGNKNAIQALIGQIMGRTQGKADPQKAKALLESHLNKMK